MARSQMCCVDARPWISTRCGPRLPKVRAASRTEPRLTVSVLTRRSVEALRLLQAAGKVDRDGLPLGELVQRHRPRLPMTVAGRLHPTERQLYLSADRRRVDV